MRTIIVSAFPSSGKSHMYRNSNGDPYIILDVQTQKFYDGDEFKKKEFEEYILRNIGKVDFIFINTNTKMINSLNELNLRFFLVYPTIAMKKHWISRMRASCNYRNDTIEFISDNYEEMIEKLEGVFNPKRICHMRIKRQSDYLDNTMLAAMDAYGIEDNQIYMNNFFGECDDENENNAWKKMSTIYKMMSRASTDSAIQGFYTFSHEDVSNICKSLAVAEKFFHKAKRKGKTTNAKELPKL